MLKSTGKVLDAFHALNVVINKDLTASEGERELLECTAAERRQLNGRIGHLFQGMTSSSAARPSRLTKSTVLASSLKLEYPLNNTLPSTEHSRDRLLAKIYASRSDTTRSQASTEEDFSLIYIYGRLLVSASRRFRGDKCLQHCSFGDQPAVRRNCQARR